MVVQWATNDVKGGKKILGLSNAWTIVSRSNKGIEVAVGTRRRVCLQCIIHMIRADMDLL